MAVLASGSLAGHAFSQFLSNLMLVSGEQAFSSFCVYFLICLHVLSLRALFGTYLQATVGSNGLDHTTWF